MEWIPGYRRFVTHHPARERGLHVSLRSQSTRKTAYALRTAEGTIPTGKLFGLRKFDKVLSTAGPAFIKGQRSSGYFSISKLDGVAVHNSIKAAACQRLSARTTTLTERTRLLPALNDRVSAA